MPATMADFNKAIDELTDMANELDIKATSAIFDEEETGDILTVFFNQNEANPLTLNAEQ